MPPVVFPPLGRDDRRLIPRPEELDGVTDASLSGVIFAGREVARFHPGLRVLEEPDLVLETSQGFLDGDVLVIPEPFLP